MNFKSVLNLGALVAGTAFPPLGAAIKLINMQLPADKQLPESATGSQAEAAMMTLPASAQASLLLQEIAAEVTKDNNFKDVVLALNEADARGASARPHMADKAMNTLVGLSVAMMSCIMWAVGTGDTEMIKNIKDMWPLVLALLFPFATVVKQYFGIRTQEKRARLQAAVGQPVINTGVLQSVKGLLK